MTNKEEKTDVCRNCRHYLKTDIQQGLCRRYPPVPMVMGMNQQGPVMGAGQPVVNDKGTCGEFSPKDSVIQA